VFADENRHRTVRLWFWLGSNHPCIRISVEITNREMFLARKRGKVRRYWRSVWLHQLHWKTSQEDEQ
jgi:hypothetical protein